MNQIDDTFARLRTILVRNHFIPESYHLNMQDSLREDLNLDSIEFLSLMERIEVEFDLNIPPKDEARFTKIGNIVAFLTNRHISEVV